MPARLGQGGWQRGQQCPQRRHPEGQAAAAKAAQFASTHAHMLLMGGVLVLLILVIFCFITSCSGVLSGRDGHGLDHFLHCRGRGHSGRRSRLPGSRRSSAAEVAAIPSSYPDYDEYTWDLDPITHDPHELAAVLTAIHEAYTRGEVQGTMQSIF